MAARLFLTSEADQDIAEAYWWYENQRLGLGEEFFRSVEAALDVIRRLPELRAPIHRNYRRALLRRFPYCVFYKFEGERSRWFISPIRRAIRQNGVRVFARISLEGAPLQ